MLYRWGGHLGRRARWDQYTPQQENKTERWTEQCHTQTFYLVDLHRFKLPPSGFRSGGRLWNKGFCLDIRKNGFKIMDIQNLFFGLAQGEHFRSSEGWESQYCTKLLNLSYIGLVCFNFTQSRLGLVLIWVYSFDEAKYCHTRLHLGYSAKLRI